VLLYRCPRCRAEDISSDAHPTRVLDNGQLKPALVCRRCYRAAELELRIACTAADIPYAPMPIRDALRLLADFYLDRLADRDDPDLLMDDAARYAAKEPVQRALDDVRRRLALEPIADA
jgi:recombinational DNA repair protein (RecF pathway)